VLHYVAKITVANVGACISGDCSQCLVFCYCRKKTGKTASLCQQCFVIHSVCVKLCFDYENRVYTLSKKNCENKYYLSHVCLCVTVRPQRTEGFTGLTLIKFLVWKYYWHLSSQSVFGNSRKKNSR
jgi:hypothetical protein